MWSTWCALGAPTLMLMAGLWPAAQARHKRRGAEAAAVLALLLAVLAAVGLAVGPAPATGWVLLDSLSMVMLLLVSFIGAVVVRFSSHYLDGDPGQARFTRWLCLTLAAVQTLTIAGHLAGLAAAWVATSLALHQLLTFYGQRPAAQLAARKKFVASRLGDLSLLAAGALIWQAFGTLQFGPLFAAVDAARQAGGLPAEMPWIAALLAAAALLKSAQFPFHGWLPEVMDTPTPVSALLHAGIINAGGLLLIRMHPLILPVEGVMQALVVVGAFTALFGATVMLTQTSVKVALAWSTLAQMGFMILQCGLGAYAAALLHIVAHSLYKAHAFLGAGGAVDDVRQARAGTAPSVLPLLLALVCALAASALLQTAVAPWLPAAAHPTGPVLLVLGLLFAAVLLLQVALPRWGRTAAGRAAYVHLSNGLYVNAGLTRALQRCWPAPTHP